METSTCLSMVSSILFLPKAVLEGAIPSSAAAWEPRYSLVEVPVAFIFVIWSKMLGMSFQHLLTSLSLRAEVGKREEKGSTLLSST